MFFSEKAECMFFILENYGILNEEMSRYLDCALRMTKKM